MSEKELYKEFQDGKLLTELSEKYNLPIATVVKIIFNHKKGADNSRYYTQASRMDTVYKFFGLFVVEAMSISDIAYKYKIDEDVVIGCLKRLMSIETTPKEMVKLIIERYMKDKGVTKSEAQSVFEVKEKGLLKRILKRG